MRRLSVRGAAAPRSRLHSHLCRAEIERFRSIAADASPMTIACTQEVAAFRRGGRRGGTYRAHHLRQYPRSRRLVARCGQRRTEDGRACWLRQPSRCRLPPSSVSRARASFSSTAVMSAPSKLPIFSRSISTSRCCSSRRWRRAATQHRVSGRSRAQSAPPKDTSAPSRLPSTTSRSRRLPRATNSYSGVAQGCAIAVPRHPGSVRGRGIVPCR